MAKILDMPKLSPTMEEGVLQAWHKNEGDPVGVDDLLAEVETDKATMEFRAFDKGTLLKILVTAGTNVKLGQAVAILGNVGDDISKLLAQAGASAEQAGASADHAAPAVAQAEAASAPTAAPSPEPARASAAPESAEVARPRQPVAKGSLLSRTERDVVATSDDIGESGRVLASPYVRKVARERGIDLSSAHGSGDHGRILPADLEGMSPGGKTGNGSGSTAGSALVARAPQTGLVAPSLAQPEVRPLSPMRKTIARRLTQSKQTVPHFYLTIDIDASPLGELRERINEQLKDGAKKGSGDDGAKPEKISLNDLLIKGVAAALLRVPEANAQFTEEAILVHKRVDISVAVAIPDGLVTPVVRNADQKSVVAIAREVRDLASRARAKKLKPEEMSDGTFSISNLGMFGIDEFSAVINPPEGAILAVGQARDEPVIKDGAVVAGKKMALTLSCDHRVIDGAVGAAFLAELRALLEHPMRILTG
jgi:pyruvate dehydrogenase E2 component (dihydrolipoamide acetyltransferase)